MLGLRAHKEFRALKALLARLDQPARKDQQAQQDRRAYKVTQGLKGRRELQVQQDLRDYKGPLEMMGQTALRGRKDLKEIRGPKVFKVRKEYKARPARLVCLVAIMPTQKTMSKVRLLLPPFKTR